MDLTPIHYSETDLAQICVPVTLGSARYELREADEATAKQYRAASLTGVEMTVGQNEERTIRKLQGIVGLQAFLLSRCLFENIGPEKDKDGQPAGPDRFRAMSEERVLKLPSRIVKDLFERCKDISELDEKEDLPTLKRQLAKLQARIAKVEGDLPNAGQGNGTPISASPTS